MRTRMTTEQRREQLLSIGSGLFAQRPYDEVWIEDVAEIAGISRGLLYHYFANKREFFRAIVERESARLLEASGPDPTLPLLDQLRAGLDVYIEFAARHPDGYRVAHRYATADDGIRSIKESRLAVQSDRILSALAGVIRVDESTRIAVDAWFAFVTAAILDWLDTREQGSGRPEGGSSAMSRDDLRDLCVRTLLAAIGWSP